jgi:hypothetical protein
MAGSTSSPKEIVMQSSPLLARLMRLGLVFITPGLLLSACATRTVYNRPASDCSTLVPKSLVAPTPGAPLPSDPSAGAWVVFGDAQTGQLDKANIDKQAQFDIVQACEKRDREAAQKVTKRPWWAVFG